MSILNSFGGIGSAISMGVAAAMQAAKTAEKSKYSMWNNYYSVTNSYGSNSEILHLHNDGPNGQEAWYNFDRWYSNIPDKEGSSGRHYIFICRPDLHLFESAGGSKYTLSTKSHVNSDPFFQYMATCYPAVLASLAAEFSTPNSSAASTGTSKSAAAGSGFGNSFLEDGSKDANGNTLTIHSLIPYLTGRVESLQLPDYTIKQYNLTQPYTRYSIPYASSAIESQTGGSFDLTFRDDRDFSIRKLFYAWIYYMDGVMHNKFIPKDKYIRYNAFDYATSIYDIQVDDTGENIVWWSKYTGAFPTSVPISDLSFNKGSAPDSKVSIPFAYYHYRPLDPNILIDLNYNSLGYIYCRGVCGAASTSDYKSGLSGAGIGRVLNPPVNTCPAYNIYDASINGNINFLGPGYVGRPVIIANPVTNTNTSSYFQLKWLPPT